MTELFISKDGITYQEAKGEIEINFVTIPEQILKSTACKLKLIENIKICTSDIETINLLNNSTKIFTKYTEETTNTTGKKGTITFYESGWVSSMKGSSNGFEFYDLYAFVIVREQTFSYLLNSIVKENLKKAQEMVMEEYQKSRNGNRRIFVVENSN